MPQFAYSEKRLHRCVGGQWLLITLTIRLFLFYFNSSSSICKKLLFFYLFDAAFFFLTVLMSLTGRYLWRCEKPLFYSAKKKSKVLKRRRE